MISTHLASLMCIFFNIYVHYITTACVMTLIWSGTRRQFVPRRKILLSRKCSSLDFRVRVRRSIDTLYNFCKLDQKCSIDRFIREVSISYLVTMNVFHKRTVEQSKQYGRINKLWRCSLSRQYNER